MNQHHQAFRTSLLSLIVAFLILTALAKISPYFRLDLTITKTIQSFHPAWFDLLMRSISWLGDKWQQILLPMTTAAVLLTFKKRVEALTLLLSTGGAVALSELFKRLVARPRPDGSLVIQVGQYLNPDSFPSGHALFFVGFFGALLYLSYTKLEKNWLQKILIGLFSLLIILVGISRIYLGAHWFSDVLGSYLIGTAWLLIIIHFQPLIVSKLDQR